MPLAGAGSEPDCPWLNKIAPRTKPVTIRALKLVLIHSPAISADSQFCWTAAAGCPHTVYLGFRFYTNNPTFRRITSREARPQNFLHFRDILFVTIFPTHAL